MVSSGLGLGGKDLEEVLGEKEFPEPLVGVSPPQDDPQGTEGVSDGCPRGPC